MTEQLDLIERARRAAGDRLASIVELLAATEPPEIIHEIVSCVEDLRQEILDQLTAEEALVALTRATERLLAGLPENQESQRMAEVLAMIESQGDSSTGVQRRRHKGNKERTRGEKSLPPLRSFYEISK